MYKINEFAKLINRSVKTLQRWDREGILIAQRNDKNRRYYTHEQYLTYIGESVNEIIGNDFDDEMILYSILDRFTIDIENFRRKRFLRKYSPIKD